ncbi:hypothetical protein B6D60_00665 [candidate division KSB1 bacterium 4484_87]|nr:MAG: hypothetical protein B6D60_00665 [candidate division KSB1 bacterium 4484_87]
MKKPTDFISVFFLFSLLLVSSIQAQQSSWKEIDDGLFWTKVAIPKQSDSIIVIKTDPHFYKFKLLCAGELGHAGLTAKEWAKKYKLIGVVNAGMFQPDYKSNVGYMRNFDYFNNPQVNSSYSSVAAFNPKSKDVALFRIFDLDVMPIEKIEKNYNTIIQNLRLIKRPGKNRWSQQPKKWSEVALGEDKTGNMLFIFSRAPLSMHDFNKILLKSPINIVCAQHLEGGPEASLYFSHKDVKIKVMGSFETSFNENDDITEFWPIPNVIGIQKR